MQAPSTGSAGPAMRTSLFLALLLCAGAAFAQDAPRVEFVKFDEGATSATVKDTVHGYESVDHRVRGRAGQVMTVRLDGPGAFFNVLAPGAGDVAVYNSSMDMNTWTGSLMKDGDYTVRVYQMRNNARRGNAPYSLRVTLHGGNGAKAAPPPPKAEPKPTAPAPEAATDMGLTTRYSCGGLAVAITQRKTGNDLVLEVRGRALTLAQARSASGAKFEDAKGNAFWSNDNEATLTLAGEPARKCAQQG